MQYEKLFKTRVGQLYLPLTTNDMGRIKTYASPNCLIDNLQQEVEGPAMLCRAIMVYYFITTNKSHISIDSNILHHQTNIVATFVKNVWLIRTEQNLWVIPLRKLFDGLWVALFISFYC